MLPFQSSEWWRKWLLIEIKLELFTIKPFESYDHCKEALKFFIGEEKYMYL